MGHLTVIAFQIAAKSVNTRAEMVLASSDRVEDADWGVGLPASASFFGVWAICRSLVPKRAPPDGFFIVRSSDAFTKVSQKKNQIQTYPQGFGGWAPVLLYMYQQLS
ncbi:MAG: hypothetical protein AAFY25_08175 [Pseudomonadota bacterium]